MGPTQSTRVVIEITSTLMKQFESKLPSPTVFGRNETNMKFVGRGSGRIISESMHPALIDGETYIGLDMGRNGKQIKGLPKKGLMRLYGQDITFDSRHLTTFGRDISLISEKDYQAIKAPSKLTIFPGDLANKNLEYSGIYEDAWISERSFFMLEPEAGSKFLLIKGMIPLINDEAFRTKLTVSLEGKPIATKELALDSFELKIPITSTKGRQRIDLSFDKYQVLPGDDGRITAGKMSFIGFIGN